MKVSTPFNHRVPKDVRGNLTWRSNVHRKVMEDPGYAGVIRDACSRDPLFFINGFGWTYAPKDDNAFPKLPFILYPFQEESILELIRCFQKKDKLVLKTRDMGASWICVTAVLWAWMYKYGCSFLLGSRVGDLVDQSGNPKSMFWKFDYFMRNMPEWLRPDGYNENLHRRSMHAENPETGSVVDGESTQKNFARGDRRTAIILDEFAAVENGTEILAATRDATNCRIFNSTPQGINNAFYDMHEKGATEVIRMHWSIHPVKSIGMYTTDEHGKLKVLEPSGYPVDYVPLLDGKMRSPWYDEQCKRAGSTQEIAQELDMDFLGSGHQFFNADIIREVTRKYAMPPTLVGDLDYDTETGEPIEFRADEEGKLKLWFLPNKDGNPPREHRYSCGTDVSAGTGASNSAACAWDITTKEKVLEYANPFIRPEELAKQVVAICRWLGNAFLVWESGGPGRQFGSRVREIGYSNYYLKRNDDSLKRTVSDIPGVAQTRESKYAIMSDYRSAIEKQIAINRSRDSIDECLEYIFGTDGSLVHARAKLKTDPSGANANHGDRAMADALAWKGILERGVSRISAGSKPEILAGSLAWRNEMRMKMRAPDNPDHLLRDNWRMR